jgi:predicted transcriptional regulator
MTRAKPKRSDLAEIVEILLSRVEELEATVAFVLGHLGKTLEEENKALKAELAAASVKRETLSAEIVASLTSNVVVQKQIRELLDTTVENGGDPDTCVQQIRELLHKKPKLRLVDRTDTTTTE